MINSHDWGVDLQSQRCQGLRHEFGEDRERLVECWGFLKSESGF